MIQVRVQKSLGDFNLDISFSVPAKGVTALFGPSGSGKTSVINMIAGLLRPGQGRIVTHGQVLFDSDQGVNLPPNHRRVGYVFQEARLFPHLSVRANLTYGMKRSTRNQRRPMVEAVVELLGVGPLLKRRPARLSGGEKQRVAIGRALLSGPRLLLLDEPLASLDEQRKEELIPYIARLAAEQDLPIIYVSHVRDEISRLASHLVMLEAGQVSATNRLADLEQGPAAEDRPKAHAAL